MRKYLAYAMLAIGVASAPAQAYTDQQSGLLIFCASFNSKDGQSLAYVTPVYKLSNKSYDQYWNWEQAANYEQSFKRPISPGTYGSSSIQGQFSKALEEKKHLGRGNCWAATSMEMVKTWRRGTDATIVANEWRDFRPSGYYAQVEEVIEFPHN